MKRLLIILLILPFLAQAGNIIKFRNGNYAYDEFNIESNISNDKRIFNATSDPYNNENDDTMQYIVILLIICFIFFKD